MSWMEAEWKFEEMEPAVIQTSVTEEHDLYLSFELDYLVTCEIAKKSERRSMHRRCRSCSKASRGRFSIDPVFNRAYNNQLILFTPD